LSTFIIFGATGATGRFLLPALLERGDRIHAVSRRPPAPAGGPQPAWVQGDLFGAIGALPPAADIIVSLGPLDAFSAWFDSAPVAGVRRVIALSSMSAETKSDSPDLAERALAQTLRVAEQRLLRSAAARGITCTLLRPTLIYGGGPDRSLVPIARLALRWHVLPIPLGAKGLRQPVHAADLAGAVDAVSDCAAAHGKVYALGGGERLRFDRMLLRLRAAIPKFVLPLPLPQVIIRAALRMRSGRDAGGISAAAVGRVRADLVADNSEAARDFGYAPRAFVAEDVVAAACR
jgi:nucleoside-diphosphate-sugar epimerase